MFSSLGLCSPFPRPELTSLAAHPPMASLLTLPARSFTALSSPLTLEEPTCASAPGSAFACCFRSCKKRELTFRPISSAAPTASCSCCRRVCEVKLMGDHKFTIKQQKYKVSDEIKQGEASELFGTSQSVFGRSAPPRGGRHSDLGSSCCSSPRARPVTDSSCKLFRPFVTLQDTLPTRSTPS